MGREAATDSAYHSFHESEVRTTRRSYRGWWIAALTIGGLQSLALLQVVQQQNSLVTQLTSRPSGWTQLTSEGYSANIGIHGTTHVPLVDKPKKLLKTKPEDFSAAKDPVIDAAWKLLQKK